MKKLLSFLGAIAIISGGSASVVSCNNSSTATTANLSSVTSISAPNNVTAAASNSVTELEVWNAIAANVQAAVDGAVSGALPTTDYTYDIFKDNTGAVYVNVDLSTATADVYVKVSSVSTSTILTGTTGYIKVTLPKARTNIMDITSISAPSAVTAASTASVTKAEVETALNTDVQAAVVAAKAGVVKTTDYTYDVFKDAAGAAYVNLDLSTATGDVYVKITAVPASTLITGSTEYIKVTLPIATTKASLNVMTSIDAPASVVATDPTAVIKTEVETALDPKVQAAVVAIKAGVVKTTDYTYDVFKDAAGAAYVNLDLSTATGDVYVVITAVPASTLIAGNTLSIKVTLPKIS